MFRECELSEHFPGTFLRSRRTRKQNPGEETDRRMTTHEILGTTYQKPKQPIGRPQKQNPGEETDRTMTTHAILGTTYQKPKQPIGDL